MEKRDFCPQAPGCLQAHPTKQALGRSDGSGLDLRLLALRVRELVSTALASILAPVWSRASQDNALKSSSFKVQCTVSLSRGQMEPCGSAGIFRNVARMLGHFFSSFSISWNLSEFPIEVKVLEALM